VYFPKTKHQICSYINTGLTFDRYYNAKLLLSAEYLVLNGAKALAVPLRFGQRLQINESDCKCICWSSLSYDGSEWFRGKFALTDFSLLECSDPKIAVHPQKLLLAARQFNPDFLKGSPGIHLVATLNYPIQWGLGSSSTLIAAVAGWAGIDPFQLHFGVSSGSGYDIACAISNKPLVYTYKQRSPEFELVSFAPSFADKIYFVYQGKKQDSAEGIKNYRKRNSMPDTSIVKAASILTDRMLYASTLLEFEQVISDHELLISSLLGIPSIKKTIFSDLPGEVKSLGAWGGDFCMLTWHDDPALLAVYLKSKGLGTYFNFNDIVL